MTQQIPTNDRALDDSVSALGLAPWAAYRRAVLCLLFVLAGVVALAIDMPVARLAQAPVHPRLMRDLFDKAEPFGHGLGAMLILGGIWVLHPARRWALPRVVVCMAIAGLGADFIKVLVARSRPYFFDVSKSSLESFAGVFPLWDSVSGTQSFPSGHTATAVALAIGLAWIYPHARWYFYAIAALVACQRIETSAHFVSDTLFGAALGVLASGLVWEWGRLPGWLTRAETFWRERCWPYGAGGELDSDVAPARREAA